MNIKLLSLTSFVLFMILIPAQLAVNATTKLSVIVSTPTLVPLVKSAAGNYVEVSSVVPFEHEPHEYQLAPKDLEKISNSDMLIITGHFKWEEDLASLIDRGKVLDLYKVLDGKLKLLNLPDGDVNLHEWWLSPYNAKLVINEIVYKLAEIDRYNAKAYTSLAEKSIRSIDKIVAEVNRTLGERGLTGDVAICSTPIEQYLIEEFGLRCSLILTEEELVGVKPLMLEKARMSLAENSPKVLVLADISEGTAVADAVKKLADETNTHLLRFSIISKDDWDYDALLAYNAGLITNMPYTPKASFGTDEITSILISILSVVVVIEAIIILRLRMRRP
ncbi:MAG: zinc ABC transporter substrate-binding protein [Nitrososphaerota archaeon]|nr:zinc ABC transporter substrate-binding protein [Aigarchaeota archaeon]MDW8076543.1 zinc ABC transporter substrate-binding protein [Nitrososphaerota archaeon]